MRAKTAYIAPGSPFENGYIESFNARLRDKLHDCDILYTMNEVRIVLESWRGHYNADRPHSSLCYRPPLPEGIVLTFGARPATLPVEPEPTRN